MLFSIGLDSVGESPFEDFAESAEQRYRPVGGWVVVVRFPWFFQDDCVSSFLLGRKKARGEASVQEQHEAVQ